ncbi:ABC transporter substrate-binding protein [Subtercola frigoramans]|uniref:Multiple sugar transport system substrate-binding protein n=1 Tax=Subtercola frigoramans TaxID=120298 RepID=A0ABS2L4A5_9MICO|nr:ABC transporter substrate-binding protein [Subtercola frigoramans]MBM7471286.1 multiple sugar transport system substrate-binding protein [Subtercola frigoramans]
MAHSTRKIITVTAMVAAALMLSACGSAGASNPSGTVGGSISYSFWGSPARADKVNTVIELFGKAHPGTTITGDVADYTSYVERFTVRAAGGGLSCAVGTQSTFVAPYAQKNVLRPLDDLISGGQIDTTDIPKDVMAAGQIDGKQYILPTGTFVRLLAYNTQMIREAGAQPPTDTMTWEQYGAWLRSVQSGLPDGKWASEIEASNMFSLTSWVIGHGQKMFDGKQLGFDKALLQEWFQFWVDLSKDGVTVPASMIPDQVGALELTPLATGVAAVGTRDIPQLYTTEKTLNGAGAQTTVAEVNIPKDEGKSANVVGVNGISIPNSCNNVATAASFANFFANDTSAGVAFQSDNGILTNTKAQDALVADPGTPAGVKQNVTILKKLTEAGDLTTTTYPAGLSTLTSELSRVYQDVAFGRSSVNEAVDQFFTAASDALK